MTDLRTLQQQWDDDGAHYRVRSYRFTAPPRTNASKVEVGPNDGESLSMAHGHAGNRTRWQTALGSLPYFLPRFALIAAGMALVIGFAAITP